MKTSRVIYGIIFICFLAFVAGPMFFGSVKSVSAAQKMTKPAAQPEMKAPMKPAKMHKKTAKKTMKSEEIMSVQKALNGAGFKLSEDGIMGKHTRQALMKYQKDNNLKPTGKADKETLAKLGVK
ncbi:MAG: peptidoglycan-binding protein [Desulfobacterales bacterium]|jgi:peptidoglycan hydrolase-like protein with peptidoglycan-binding domain|nr:peptidoglycan-binding protein [Desulfobacterales bacterium]